MGFWDQRIDLKVTTLLVVIVIAILAVQSLLIDTQDFTVDADDATSWTYEVDEGQYIMWQWHTDGRVEFQLLDRGKFENMNETYYARMAHHNGTSASGRFRVEEDTTLVFSFHNEGTDTVKGTVEVNNNLNGPGILLVVVGWSIAAYFGLHGVMGLRRSRLRKKGLDEGQSS